MTDEEFELAVLVRLLEELQRPGIAIRHRAEKIEAVAAMIAGLGNSKIQKH